MPAIEIAVSRYAEIGALEAEVGDLEGRLEARKRVDRAKAVLQNESASPSPKRSAGPEDLDGPSPTMREVAEAILSGDVLPDTSTPSKG